MTDEQTQDQIPGMQVGIDLGTTNSTVAYFQNGKREFLEIRNSALIPSAIYFASRDENKWYYGEPALRRGMLYPDALLRYFKRNIGKQEKFVFQCADQAEITVESKTYIIDTNVFIDAPYVLGAIPDTDKIIIPKTVYEELGYREKEDDTEEAAKIAKEEIEKNASRIIFAESNLDLLPGDDMFKKAVNYHDINDNKILSIALQYNTKDTVLLSSDRGVKQKAAWIEDAVFIVESFDEFQWKQTSKPKKDATLELTGKDGAVYFLRYLRNELEKKLGPVTRAVITVPMGFSPIQTSEIKDAGIAAGFSEVEVHPEPIAAAVAYGMGQIEDKTILVYDFGGGTFDVCILRKEGDELKPISLDGDPALGGEDFTQALVFDVEDRILEYCDLDMFSEEDSGLSHEDYVQNKLRIWSECERVKKALSDDFEEEISVSIKVASGEKEEFQFKYTRDIFDDITAELRSRAKKALEGALTKANLKREDIDAVILAGGTSTIPGVRKTVERYFGQKSYSDRDPATLIAEGAAVFADIRWNQETTIDKKIRIFDKTMDDFGVSYLGHKFDCVIPVDTELPVRQVKQYSLVKDDQEELNLEIFTRAKGSNAEVTMDEDIQFIGKIHISSIPPYNRSDVDVEVTFEITKEYVLNASVRLVDKEGNEIRKAGMNIEKVGV